MDNKLIGNEKNILFYNDEEVNTKVEILLENNIILNLNKIKEVTDMTSSNPFDYTIFGVVSYLSALAIQDITQCNLQEEYNLDLSTADEFYNLWKENNCSFKK